MDLSILCEQFCQYCTSIRGQSKATIQRYRYAIGGFSKFMGVSDLSKVTEANVRQLFLYGRIERNWSANTFRVYHVSLLVFFRWCIKQGYMASNPVLDIEVPRLEKRIPKGLSKHDALRLLEVALNYPCGSKFTRRRNHAMFATFLFAGLRKQELLSLKYSDVDVENFSIFVRQGKGSKDRIVPISFTLAQTLKQYVGERKKAKKTCPEFFTSAKLNAGFTADSLKFLVVQMRCASKIVFTVHQLRHTFATLMNEGGCDIYSLSKMLGHSDIKTTTIYLSASAEHLRTEITKHPLNDIYMTEYTESSSVRLYKHNL